MGMIKKIQNFKNSNGGKTKFFGDVKLFEKS